jgi:hypothetical protein
MTINNYILELFYELPNKNNLLSHNILLYITTTIIVYFFFKSILISIFSYVLIVLFILLFFENLQLLKGSLLGLILGLITVILLFQLSGFSKKTSYELKYRYILQSFILFFSFIISDIDEIIPDSGFKIGLMKLYLIIFLILLLYYFINGQTKELVSESWEDIEEYDNAYIYLFITIFMYIITPFVFFNINVQLLSIIVTIVLVIFYLIMYIIS